MPGHAREPRLSQPPIILDRVDYETAGGRKVEISGVTYLGLGPRESDGFTVLSVMKPGSTRAFSIETGNVLSITKDGAGFRPLTRPGRFRLREAEMRSFIEGTPLVEWARPYFDPSSEKYHGRERSHPPFEETLTIEVKADDVLAAWAAAPPNPAHPAEPSYLMQVGRRLLGIGAVIATIWILLRLLG